MPTTTSKKVSPKKSPAKAKTVKPATPKKKTPPKKAAPKKAAPPKEEVQPTSKQKRLSATQLEVLKVLSESKKPLTRKQISEALEGRFIGGNVMGHINPEKVIPTSLYGRGLVKIEQHEGEGNTYVLTAAGRSSL